MEVTEIRLLSDRVIVRRDQSPEMEGSIHIPEAIQNDGERRAQTGVVLVTGPGKFSEKLLRLTDPPIPWRHGVDVKPGDRVCFSRYTGGPVEGFPDCIIMRESDVLAVIGSGVVAHTGNAMAGRFAPFEGRGPETK